MYEFGNMLADQHQQIASHAAASAQDIAAVRSELEQARKDLADYKASQDAQRRADIAQAVVDKKQQRRHEYLVAAFSVALTLLIEHFFDLVNLANLAFKSLSALFQ